MCGAASSTSRELNTDRKGAAYGETALGYPTEKETSHPRLMEMERLGARYYRDTLT